MITVGDVMRRVARLWQGARSGHPSVHEVLPEQASIAPRAQDIELAWQLGGQLDALVEERLLTSTLLSGDQLSRRLGMGLDFEQLRAYQPGEPAHAIDWRVSARSQQPMVRLYREPAQRQCHFLLDTGATMRFGTRRQLKLTQALLTVHLLSAAALRQGMACAIHDPALIDQPSSRPTTSRAGLLRQLDDLSALIEHEPVIDDAEVTDWVGLRARLESALPAGQMLVVLSDFLTDVHDAESARVWLPLAQRHRLVFVHLVDPAEQDLPDMGRATFVDSHGAGWQLDTGKHQRAGRALRERMAQDYAARQRALRDLAEATGGRYQCVTTEMSLPELVEGWSS